MHKKLSYFIVFLIGGFTSLVLATIWVISVNAHLEYPDKINEDRLFEVVNKWRKENGYSELKKSLALCGYAIKRARDSQSNWSHEPFWVDIPLLQKELNYKMLGENISTGFNSEYEVLTAWLNSPKHKENIVKDYTDSCIKCEHDNCTQIFAKF